MKIKSKTCISGSVVSECIVKGERFSMKVGEFVPVSVSLPRNPRSLVTPPSAGDRDNVATILTFQGGHNKVDNSDKITQPRQMSMNPEKFLESMLKMLKSYSFVDGYQFLHMQEILGCEEKFGTKIFLHIFVCNIMSDLLCLPAAGSVLYLMWLKRYLVPRRARGVMEAAGGAAQATRARP